MTWPLAFTNPGGLLLLPLLPLAWWVSRHTLADLSEFRRRLSLALRIIILACLVLGVAGTQLVLRSTRLATLFVVDLSDSVREQDKQAGLQFINQAVREMRSGDQAGVVVFGEDAFVELAPTESLKLREFRTVLNRNFTDLAQALRLAMAAFPESAQKRVVLISDGNENLGRALDEAGVAKANRIQVDVLPLKPVQGPEVVVDRMLVPSQAKVGEPFELKIIATSRTDTKGLLRVWQDGQLIEERGIALSAGKNEFPLSRHIDDPKFVRFEAKLWAENDTLADNNTAQGFTLVRGKPKVLYVEGDPGESGYLSRALAEEKIDVATKPLSGIPTGLAEFQQYDAVILSDVPALAMSDLQMEMIRATVRDLGTGLIMIGGEQSFGEGGWMGTPVEEALPVSMDISNKKYIPAGALVLVVHSMEFPQGDAWARETCKAVVRTLNAQDKLGVIRWSMKEDWLIPLQPVRDRGRMLSIIDGLYSGDMPAFDPTLKMATDALIAEKESRVKHIVVLSDGDPNLNSVSLLKQMRQNRITMSTVCIGPHGNTAQAWGLMKDMATAGGGRFYLVRNGTDIPQIFIKEAKVVKKSAIVEKPFAPRRTTAEEDFMKGISDPIPKLLGYVSTSEKKRAQLSLVSHLGDPVLASWQYGLGRSVAFTSDCKRRWGAGWLQWPMYRRFWSQVVRWCMRRSGNFRYDSLVDVEAGQGKITVEALDSQSNFVTDLEAKARVVSPLMHTLNVELEQTSPGHYAGTFEAREVGQYVVNLSYRDSHGNSGAQTAGVVVPYSPEYKDLKSNEYLLRRLSDMTGGRVLAKPEQVFGEGRTGARQSLPIWRALIILALCLLPLDIAVRRIMFDRREFEAGAEKVRDYVSERLLRRPVGAPAREPVMGTLLSAKKRALRRRGVPEPTEEAAQPPLEATAPSAVRPTPTPHPPTPAVEPGEALARLRAAKQRARQRGGEDQGQQ